MYRLEPSELLGPRYLALWSLLAFQAGFVNSFGFLACQRYVSHVTGFGTQVGMALAGGDLVLAGTLAGAPASFVAGAFTSAWFTVARTDSGRRPRYDLVTGAIPAILAALAVAGTLGCFGSFGELLLRPRDFVLLFTLSFVCGMQNACFATMTGGRIRTTHLTGVCTDLGTDLARTVVGELGCRERDEAVRGNVVRVATFGAFAFGAIFSVMVDARYTYEALWFPAATASLAAVAVQRIGRKLDLDRLRRERAARRKPPAPAPEDPVLAARAVH